MLTQASGVILSYGDIGESSSLCAKWPLPLVLSSPAGVAVSAGIAAAASLSTAYYLRQKAVVRKKKEALRSKRKTFQDKRESSIDKLKIYVEDQARRNSSELNSITSLPFNELVQCLRDSTISPADALAAYQWKAMAAHDECNSIIQPFERAGRVSAACGESSGKPPLYGVPISLKDDYTVQSYTSALGISHMLEHVSIEDCVLVKVLKSQGAVPFVKTTVAQSCLSYESGNPITGDTLNPHDSTRTPGGSSGGECALVGAGGSVLGFGSDVAGSIRLPAHFCGVVGLKATSNRLSHRGNYSSYDCGQQIVWSCWGPISREVDGAVAGMRALLTDEMFRLDTRIPPIPFNEQLFSSSRPLRIGFYVDDGVLAATPPCERAVHLARHALELQGHQLVEWSVPNAKLMREVVEKVLVADGGNLFRQTLGHDDMHPCLSYIASKMPKGGVRGWLERQLSKFMRLYEGKEDAISKGHGSAGDYWKLTSETEMLRLEFMTSWEEAGLDALLCPPCAIVATRIGNSNLVFETNTSLVMYNMLDVPAGVVPVTKVTPNDLHLMNDYASRHSLGQRIQEDMVGSEGIPVGVQCVAPRWREEVVLRMMKDIERGLQSLNNDA